MKVESFTWEKLDDTDQAKEALNLSEQDTKREHPDGCSLFVFMHLKVSLFCEALNYIFFTHSLTFSAHTESEYEFLIYFYYENQLSPLHGQVLLSTYMRS